MKHLKESLFAAMAVICAVSPGTLRSEVSADSVMFRRRPSSSQEQKRAVAADMQTASVSSEKADPVPVKNAAPSADEKKASVAAPERKVPKSALVPVEKAAQPAGEKLREEAAGEKKPEPPPQRDAIITADRTDYDRKEGVVLFDRNVYVDDAQYKMHTDRLFLFLDGTNDLKRLVAIGNVAITNENRRAYCARATFNKKLGRIVMYSSDEITAELREEGKKGSEVKGEKITFWIDSEQVEVENPVITMPGGFGGKDSLKKAVGR